MKKSEEVKLEERDVVGWRAEKGSGMWEDFIGLAKVFEGEEKLIVSIP